MVIDGSISFQYRIESSGTGSSNGLELFVDGEQQRVPYHPSPSLRSGFVEVEHALTAGMHVIEWNYHQEDRAVGKVRR